MKKKIQWQLLLSAYIRLAVVHMYSSTVSETSNSRPANTGQMTQRLLLAVPGSSLALQGFEFQDFKLQGLSTVPFKTPFIAPSLIFHEPGSLSYY